MATSAIPPRCSPCSGSAARCGRCNTVQFSSHAGYPGWRGEALTPALLRACVAGLDAIGVLARCQAVLTGYLNKAETGEAALDAVAAVRARNPGAVYACDPVIGDDGRVYVGAGVAEFIRDPAPCPPRRSSAPMRSSFAG